MHAVEVDTKGATVGRASAATRRAELTSLDLNLLVPLHALLTERSVSRAARQVLLSQPAMSHALRRLRSLFADPLLVRQGSNYELTALAAALVDPVTDLLSMIDHTVNLAPGFDPATDSREITIRASEYATVVFLQPLIGSLGHTAPGLSLKIEPFREPLPDVLRHGATDFVVAPPGFAPGFPGEPLFEDSFVCVACARHPTLTGELSLETFSSLPHASAVLFDHSMRKGLVLAEHFETHGVHRNVVVETDNFLVLPYLVRGTTMLALMPRRLAGLMNRDGSLSLYPLPVATPGFSQMLFWNPIKATDPALVWFRTFLRRRAMELDIHPIRPGV